MNQPLTDIRVLRAALEKSGIAPDYALGQNFLVCAEVVEAAIIALQDAPRQVTELGSGAGTVTQALAAHGFHVRAIEKDDQLAEVLPQHIPAKDRHFVQAVHGDLKRVPWMWDSPYCVVGNIPYNLSGLVIRRLTQLHPAPYAAILLVQKEVGQRMMATPPNMSLISLAVALWGKAERLLSVPPSCFWPQPKVHSQLMLLTPHKTPLAGTEERERIMSFAKVFFQQKRKQLGGMLQQNFRVQDIENTLAEVQVTKQSRPQELTARQWQTLAQKVEGF